MIETFATAIDSTATILGWTILHSIWQVLLIAIILKVLLLGTSKYAAAVRYNLSIIALLFAFFWSAHTFLGEWQQHQIGTTSLNEAISFEPYLALDSSDELEQSASGLLDGLMNSMEPIMPYLAIFWFIGMLFFASRIFIGLFRLHVYSNKGTQILPLHWQTRFEALKQLVGINRIVNVRLSKLMLVPITYRFFRPIILLPVSVFTGLSDEQIEVLLLHELAHIKRHDYVVNLLQSVIEVLFFYHPLIWWIGKNVRAEREHCCDDVVMKLRHQPMLYAQTLTQIQSQHYSLKTQLAMSANGNKGVFTQRIYRLFQQKESPARFRNSAIALLLLFFSGAMMAFYPAALQKPLNNNAPSDKIVQDTVPKKLVETEVVAVENIPRVVVIGSEKKKSTDEEKEIKEEEIIELEIPYEVEPIRLSEILEIKRDRYEVEEIEKEIPEETEPEVVEVVSVPIVKGTYRVETDKNEKVRMKINKEGEYLTIQTQKGKNPLVLLNKKLFKDWTIDGNGKITMNILSEDVNTVTIYKGSKTKAMLGVEHLDDIIEVVSKNVKAEPMIEFPSLQEAEAVIRTDSVPNNDQPLFVIDGEITKSINLDDELSPDDILTINVLKGKSALDKYGTDGRNGVIEIITKDKKLPKEHKVRKYKERKADRKIGDRKVKKPTNEINSRDFNKDGHFTISTNSPDYETHIKIAARKKNDANKDKKVRKRKERKADRAIGDRKVMRSTNQITSTNNNTDTQLTIFPNPTDNETNIKIVVEEKGDVKLSIYDVRGQLIEVLVNKILDKGSYDYEWDSNKLSAGSYFVKLDAAGDSVTKQLVVQK